MVCRKWYNASQDLQFQVTCSKEKTHLHTRNCDYYYLKSLCLLCLLLLLAEERYLLLPRLSLILGADQGSREKILLQTEHQPA